MKQLLKLEMVDRHSVRRTSIWVFTVVLMGVLGMISVAQTKSKTQTQPAVAAPSAGLQKLNIPYYDVSIEVVLWYPTRAPSRSIDAVSVQFDAAPNAPVKENKHPLVLVSHGTGGMNLGHYPLTVALARAGFIVASMTHPGDNFRDRSLIADKRYFSERPRQISHVLNALLADKQWGPLIDSERIGALGHSAGAYAVAALVGGEPDRPRLAAHCQTVNDDPACEYGDPAKGISQPVGKPFVLPADASNESSVKDDRIRSAVLLAPLGVVIAPDSLTKTNVPVKLVGAANDEILARQYHYEWIKSQLEQSPASARHSISLAEGTTHFSFLAPFKASFIEVTRSELGAIVEPLNGFDRTGFQARLAKEVVLWMQSTLER